MKERTEQGSVTAELVVVTPVIILLILIVVSVVNFSAARLALVGELSVASRAVSVGKTESEVAELLSEGNENDYQVSIAHEAEMSLVKIKRNVSSKPILKLLLPELKAEAWVWRE